MNGIKNGSVVGLMAVSVALTSWLASGNDLSFKAEGDKIKDKDENIGRATKCHPEDPTHVSVSWTPKELSPSGQVLVTVEYIAPHNMYGGFMNVSLYFHGESDPFVGYSNRFSCDDIKPHFKCPLLRREKFHFSKNLTNLHPLTSFPGDYDAIIDIRNENNEEIVCLNFTLHVKEI